MSDLIPNPEPPARRLFSEEPAAALPVYKPPTGSEDQTTMFFPQTPDSPPAEAPHRIPHLGHALLFLAITGFILIVAQLVLVGFGHTTPGVQSGISPKLLLGAEAFTYLASLVLAWLIFPMLWSRPFETGLQTNGPAARRNALKLIPIGIVLSFTVQAVSSVVTMPKSIPMDDFFRTPSDVWIITAFGIFLAPLFEEVLFRGFLFPAFAIAYDWLSLPRTDAAKARWNSSNDLSLPAVVFSAILSSILFAILHGKQVSYTWPVLVMLFIVSLLLTTIRIRLRSVLASTLVHASYNAAIFLTAFFATGGYRHLEKMTR